MMLVQIPVTQIVFRLAVLLDLRGCPRKSAISEQHVIDAATRAGGIRRGDIVFCNIGGARFYGTPDYALSPYFSPPAIRCPRNSPASA